MTAETPQDRTGRQILRVGQVEQRPVRFATFYRNQEVPVRHFADDFTNEILSGLRQFIEGFYTQDKSGNRDDKVWWTTKPPPMQSLASD